MHKIGLKVQGKATKLQWGLLCIVQVKVDKVDRCKFDHKSVPGVLVEVTEHDCT